MLIEALERGSVMIAPACQTRDALFALIGTHARTAGLVADSGAFAAALAERETQGTTELRPGVVVPHMRGPMVRDLFCYLVLVPDSIPWPPCVTAARLLFVIGVPPEGRHYLDMLASITRLVQTPKQFDRLQAATSEQEATAVIRSFCGPQPDAITPGTPGLHGILVIINGDDPEMMDTAAELAIELGVKGLTMLDATNATAKVALDFPFLSFMAARNARLAASALIGVSERAEVAGILYHQLKDRGLDMRAAGVGTIMTFPLGSVYGAIDSEVSW